MMDRFRRTMATACFTAIGCTTVVPPGMDFGEKSETAQVSSQFFESAPTTVAKSPIPAADMSVSARVDVTGRKVLAANPQIGMRPLFATAKSSNPEIFHVDQRMIYVTDGLVNQLPSEADLAAALSFELARMVAERESRVKPDLKYTTPQPPIQLPIGGPSPSAADMASTAELAKYDRKRREVAQASVKLNPETLARGYLEKAGFMRTDFDRIMPALQAADKNDALERQIKGTPAPSAWMK